MYFYMLIFVTKIVLKLSTIARRLRKIGHEMAKIVILYEHLCHEDWNYIVDDCASITEDWP